MLRICYLIILLSASLPTAAQENIPSTQRDSVPMSDTLRSVVITPRGLMIGKLNPFGFDIMPSMPSLSDILGPRAADKIMHPFAFVQRKKERHRRKMAKLLKQYDRLKTNNELLREALRNEGIDPDSLLNQIKQANK